MFNSRDIRIVIILVFLLAGLNAKCPDRMYIIFDDAGNPVDCKPCWDCQAGQYMKISCTTTSNSVCEPCPDGYCNPGFSNHCTKCIKCSSGTYLDQPCNKTSNTLCKSCQDGYFSALSDAKACSSCRSCSTHEKIATPCNKTSDVTCTCSDVAYRDTLTGKCRPCSSCTGPGQIVPECEQKLGHGKNICQYVENHPDKQILDEQINMALSIGIAGLLLTVTSVIILVIVIILFKKKRFIEILGQSCNNLSGLMLRAYATVFHRNVSDT